MRHLHRLFWNVHLNCCPHSVCIWPGCYVKNSIFINPEFASELLCSLWTTWNTLNHCAVQFMIVHGIVILTLYDFKTKVVLIVSCSFFCYLTFAWVHLIFFNDHFHLVVISIVNVATTHSDSQSMWGKIFKLKIFNFLCSSHYPCLDASTIGYRFILVERLV